MKRKKWNKECFTTFYDGLQENERSVWMARRLKGEEPQDDVLDVVVRFCKETSEPVQIGG